MAALSELIESRKIITLGCIFGELLQGVRSKREADIILEYWTYLPKIDETDLWVQAGRLSFDEKCFSKGIGLIDCAIAVSAKENSYKIWTLDKKLLSILKSSEIFHF